MKITIHYDECDHPLETDQSPTYNLDDLLDAFIADQVRSIINENLRMFRGMCDIWNQRELAQRRALESEPVESRKED